MRSYDIVKTTQDLRRLSWSESVNTSGTGGMFLKAREGTGAHAVYYKLSCYDSYRGVYGHECVNELVAARLMGLMGVPHADCRLVHATVRIDGIERETWLCRSKSFRKPGERKQALDLFYDLHKQPGESPLGLCGRYGWKDCIEQMMLVDFLIANRDRHGANIEVLVGPDGSCRLAPLFDNGISFAFSCYDDADKLERLDPLEDFPANNYLGTHSLEENLKFVSADVAVNGVVEGWKAGLLDNIDRAVSKEHAEKIWDMIWQRWCKYESLRDPGRPRA